MENRTENMIAANKAAKEVATKASRCPYGGWTRLAKVESYSTDDKKYVISVRSLGAGGENGAEIGCSCPDWVYRKRGTSALCKHQKYFLGYRGGSCPSKGVWLFKAGKAFLASMQASAG